VKNVTEKEQRETRKTEGVKDIYKELTAWNRVLSEEDNNRLDCQEFHRPLMTLKVRGHVHNSPPVGWILIHINPIHIFTHYFSETHFLLSSYPLLGTLVSSGFMQNRSYSVVPFRKS
jgi:hypothetical protein